MASLSNRETKEMVRDVPDYSNEATKATLLKIGKFEYKDELNDGVEVIKKERLNLITGQFT